MAPQEYNEDDLWCLRDFQIFFHVIILATKNNTQVSNVVMNLQEKSARFSITIWFSRNVSNIDRKWNSTAFNKVSSVYNKVV